MSTATNRNITCLLWIFCSFYRVPHYRLCKWLVGSWWCFPFTKSIFQRRCPDSSPNSRQKKICMREELLSICKRGFSSVIAFGALVVIVPGRRQAATQLHRTFGHFHGANEKAFQSWTGSTFTVVCLQLWAIFIKCSVHDDCDTASSATLPSFTNSLLCSIALFPSSF